MTNLIKAPFVFFFGLCCVNFAHAQWNSNGNSIYTDTTKQVRIGIDPVSIKSDEDFTVAYNSDGLDLVYSNEQPPADANIDIDEFLKRRTILSGNPEGKKELKDTQISQVFYNTSAVFNTFFHPASHFDSDLETVDSRWDSTYNVYKYCTDTIVRQNHFKSRVLLDNGYDAMQMQNPYTYDPLQAMVAYCHDTSSGKGVQELIWSFRMNDTHDDVDRHLLSQFKMGLEQTCWLNEFNTKENCPSWCEAGGCYSDCKCMISRETTLDYSCQVVRDQVIKIFRSVVENYDVDGIELDFLRHPVFFPSQMEGNPATIEEIAMMTALVTELRALCDSNGIKLAIRVTDSMDLNKEIGLDVVDWLDNDLVDIVIAGGYWHLEPWSNLAKLGSQYDVKVYADISFGGTTNSRFGHITNNGNEQTRVIYGEILSARYAGLDGVYFFNKFETGNYNPFNIAKFIDSLEAESPLYYELIQPSGGNTVKEWIRDGERFIEDPNKLEINGEFGANSTVTLESDSPALKFLSTSAGQKSYRIVNENSYLQFQSSLYGDIWDYGQPTIPLRIANSGNIDVFASGFIDSDRLLNINGNATANNLIVTNDIINQGSTPYMRLSNTGSKPFNIVSGDGKLQFQVLNTDNTFDFTAMAIYENGDITMGFGSNDIILTVKKAIRSDSLKLPEISEDRVFDKSYYLRTLKEIEQFIKTYKHLPEIPPAVETEKSVNLSEFYGLMLRKIEELTLYTIQKEDQIEELEKGLSKLKSVAIKEGLIDGPE